MPGSFFLMGANVGSSPTPRMMEAAFGALGLEAVYSAVNVEPAGFPHAFRELEEAGASGMNVTIPFKRAVVGLLDSIDKAASGVGAVNTVKREGEEYRGYNTDVEGIVGPLVSRGVRDISRATVIGTGGAARAFAGAMHRLGCHRLTALSRCPDGASAFLNDMRGAFPSMEVEVVSLDAREPPRPEVLFNATPCGSNGIPVPPQLTEMLDSHPLFFDAVYSPVETYLISQAKERGCTVVYGYEMLLYQGAEALRVWTGAAPPVAKMRESLMASLGVPT